MEEREKLPRPWDIYDLLHLGGFGRAIYLKIIPILILEKWVREGRVEGVANHIRTEQLASRLENSGLVPPFKPRASGGIFRSLTHIQNSQNLTKPPFIKNSGLGLSWINLPYYEPLLQEYRKKFYEEYPDEYKQLFSEDEPDWNLTEGGGFAHVEIQSTSVDTFKILQEYEQAEQEQLQNVENRLRELEEESREFRKKLNQSRSILDGITDEILKKRVETLLKSPLDIDMIIREAGVILEDRLRSVGKAGSDLEGIRLIDTLLIPVKGSLVFSLHGDEQEGVRMLYRGAVQFIRNPPMQKLVENPENTVQLFFRLIDLLLQLLQSAELRNSVKSVDSD